MEVGCPVIHDSGDVAWEPNQPAPRSTYFIYFMCPLLVEGFYPWLDYIIDTLIKLFIHYSFISTALMAGNPHKETAMSSCASLPGTCHTEQTVGGWEDEKLDHKLEH